MTTLTEAVQDVHTDSMCDECQQEWTVQPVDNRADVYCDDCAYERIGTLESMLGQDVHAQELYMVHELEGFEYNGYDCDLSVILSGADAVRDVLRGMVYRK